MSLTVDKRVAKDLVERLPDGATWDDLIHEICALIAINRGLEDVAAGRTRSVEEVRREYGLGD